MSDFIQMKIRATGKVFIPRYAEGVPVTAYRHWIRPILETGRDVWRRHVRKKTGGLMRSIHYRTSTRLDRLGEIYSTHPEIRQLIDEFGRKAQKPGGRAVPGTGANARATRLVEAIMQRERRTLERAIERELNR